LQAAVLSVLVISGWVEIWHIYVLAFLLGLTNAIERPTRQSFFSEIVSKERLVNAVALNSSLLNTARILGPAMGGVVIAVIGPEGTFVFNAFSFLAVLAGYFLMDAKRFYPGRKRATEGSILGQIREGLAYGFQTPRVRFILILVAFVGMFGYNFNVVTPLVAKFILHAGPGQFGLLSSFLGAGALLAAFTVAGLGRQSLRLMLGSAALFCALLFVLGLSESYWISAMLLFALGVSGTLLMTLANTTLQLGAPDEMRGRIISIFILLQAGSTPIGGLMMGQLSASLGVRDALAIHACLAAIGVILAAVLGAQLLMPKRTAATESAAAVP
jgi:MFS family permease